ncbi:MAG: hypothetical protein ACE5DI_06080, partial [Candidatus Micrarchaeia archaeon]
MRRFIALALFFSVFFAAFSSAISSEAAKNLVEGYIEGTDEVLALAPYNLQKPLEYNGRNYWMVYLGSRSAPAGVYSFSFTKFLISDEGTGSLVKDEELLETFFLHDYQYVLEQNYLTPEKLSFEDLSLSFENLRRTIDNAKLNFDSLKNSVSEREHSAVLDDRIAAIEQLLLELSDSVDVVKDSTVQTGLEFKTRFSEDGQIETYSQAVEHYNSTFEALLEFLEAYEAYGDEVKQHETFTLLLSEEQEVLTSISNIEPEVQSFPFSKAILQTRVAEYNRRLLLDSKGALKDAVSNTLFRIAKSDATVVFEKVRRHENGLVEGVLSEIDARKREVEEICDLKTEADNLKRTWALVTDVMVDKKNT